jgi:hypothetical protein
VSDFVFLILESIKWLADKKKLSKTKYTLSFTLLMITWRVGLVVSAADARYIV